LVRVNAPGLLRVVAAAFVLSTLSFAAGVAGDLSLTQQTSGTRVVLRIPPEIPTDAPRAAPLLSTASADARPMPRQRARLVSVESAETAELVHAAFAPLESEAAKPDAVQVMPVLSSKPKDNPDFAFQAEKNRKNA
jgi:hypothetical protein